VTPPKPHPLWLRCAHWIGFPAVGLLVWSGILIYWANPIYVGFFPDWFYRAFSIDHRLAEGMAIHFTMGWLLVLDGAAYLMALALSGHWRELAPNREAARTLIPTVRSELGLGAHVAHEGRFNAAQRFAYAGVISVIVLEVMSGFALYKPVQLGGLRTLLAGHAGAHFVHFAGMLTVVAFFVVHVTQVARAGWSNFTSMAARTVLGLASFAALYGATVLVWIWATRATQVQETPAPFRKVLEWNGDLWGKLLDTRKLNAYPAPAPGKRPRFNGDLGLDSAVDPATWRLEISAGPAKMLRLGIAEVRALPRTETSSLFFCIEGWSDPLSYAGVKFSDFLRFYGVGTRSGKPWNPDDPASARDLYRYVGLATPDGGYYVSIDMESMLHPQTLLAFEENGEPLDPKNGAPLRLVIPIKYGIKSLKRIGSIRFSDERPPDYWAERGYDWFAGL
jgi:thiosulfate reductase cytochrome b subunit